MPNTVDPLSSPVGTVISQKYRIERILAEGGMGLVVAATHLHLGRPVALKFLRADMSSDWDALARFTREARSAAQLKSEHVAHVLDVGMMDDGTPYMVMEYLEGQSLAHLLQTRGALDVETAVEFAVQTCEGLAEAHARGIVHRDIKPSNLFLAERSPGWRAIKILDFGISKVAVAENSNIATSLIMGSPCYMSPEQLRSTATVDQRADIWSLGATLHEMLAGTAAFDPAQSLAGLVATILEGPTPALPAHVAPELAAVVARCLAKDRADRFDNASELARALSPFAPPRAQVHVERAASMTVSLRATSPEVELANVDPFSRVSDAGTDIVRIAPLDQPRRALSIAPPPRSSVSPPPHSISAPDHGDRNVISPRGARIAIGGAALLLVVIAGVAGQRIGWWGSTPSAARSDVSVTPAPFAAVRQDVTPNATPSLDSDKPVPASPLPVPSTRANEATLGAPAPPTSTRGATPPRPAKRVAAPSVAPAARSLSASTETPTAAVPVEVDSAGGRAPLRPIDPKNPYENP